MTKKFFSRIFNGIHIVFIRNCVYGGSPWKGKLKKSRYSDNNRGNPDASYYYGCFSIGTKYRPSHKEHRPSPPPFTKGLQGAFPDSRQPEKTKRQSKQIYCQADRQPRTAQHYNRKYEGRHSYCRP